MICLHGKSLAYAFIKHGQLLNILNVLIIIIRMNSNISLVPIVVSYAYYILTRIAGVYFSAFAKTLIAAHPIRIKSQNYNYVSHKHSCLMSSLI